LDFHVLPIIAWTHENTNTDDILFSMPKVSNSTEGFQNCVDTPLPKRLSKVQTLFEKHVRTMNIAKQSFLDEVGATALVLSPKESFELRLRALNILYPHLYPLTDSDHANYHEAQRDFGDNDDDNNNKKKRKKTKKEAQVHEYMLRCKLETNQIDETYENFVMDDNRYSVDIGYYMLEEGNGEDAEANRIVTLTIK
jgi:hypothetical protein